MVMELEGASAHMITWQSRWIVLVTHIGVILQLKHFRDFSSPPLFGQNEFLELEATFPP